MCQIGQSNNCFLFPGLGFAAVAVGLRVISDGMIDADLEGLAPEGVGEEAVASLLERARWLPKYQGLDASLDALTS